MNEPKYKRVMLKLSGESLAGKSGYGIDFSVAKRIAEEIKEHGFENSGYHASMHYTLDNLAMMRSLVARNTLISSRLAAKLLPLPVEPRYIPLADLSFLRSAMMTLLERAFMP